MTTLGQHFIESKVQHTDKDKTQTLVFKNIRILGNSLGNASTAMTRLADMMQRSGRQVEHYEAVGKRNWPQKQNMYDQNILQRYMQNCQPQAGATGGGVQVGTAQQPQGFGGQSGFGFQNTSAFGAAGQSKPPGTSLFGGQSTSLGLGGQQTGAFGQPQ